MSNHLKQRESVIDIAIEKELQSSFLDYAVSVVVSRAIPDVRDGLKPVHRRVLYTMHQLGLFHNKPYRKSVKVVGEVLGNYHPHGDSAVYQTMVGMVQDFSRRYPLLDGQGNWGSVDGDNAAAMRYTEVRMQKMCQEILADINKDTVPFVPNFDESTIEPTVLPSKIPNLLINGTTGIAVGMATSIPPHNLEEVIDACIAYVKNKNISNDEIFSYIKGPDFPTGGIICGRNNYIKAYQEGRGSVTVRGVVEKEQLTRGEALVITELPYQVIKSDLIAKIAHLVRDKVIEGIHNLRDESNKKGMRVVIELKKDAHAETVLNLLYKHTLLQTSISINLLGLLNNKPQLFTLKEIIAAFVEHRFDIIIRKTKYEKEKAAAQEHILAGLQKITENVDKTLQIVTKSDDTVIAYERLKDEFDLSDIQVKSVLDLKLQRFTSLERNNIIQERKNLIEAIKGLNLILEDELKRGEEIIKELQDIKSLYGDSRKTIINNTVSGDFDESSFIVDEEVIITLTQKGYIKRVKLDTYEIQHRGGKGKMGTASLDESDDIIQDIFIAKNHDNLLFFTNLGRVYCNFVYEMPEASRTAKGRAIVNILPLTEGEYIVKLLCARNFDGVNLLMVTQKGVVKRIQASAFSNVRQTGIRALTINEGDKLSFCVLTSGNDTVIIATRNGMGIRFLETEVRCMGRQATGVRGIKLKEDDEVIGVRVVHQKRDILFVTERGYGKRVSQEDFRIAHRGGMGVRTIPANTRNGKSIGLAIVNDEIDIILIDENGKVIRISPQEIRTMGRQAQGVRLINLDKNQVVSRVAAVTGDEYAEAIERKKYFDEHPEAIISLDDNISEDIETDTEIKEE